MKLFPSGRIQTRRTQIRKRLSAIAVKRLLTCRGCLAAIDPAREPGLPVREDGYGWHAGCYLVAHPVPAPTGRDRRGDLYEAE